MYQHKVDVDMLNAVKSVLADVSSISPSSEQRRLICIFSQLCNSLVNTTISLILYPPSLVSPAEMSRPKSRPAPPCTCGTPSLSVMPVVFPAVV